jgi:hypothetical protein
MLILLFLILTGVLFPKFYFDALDKVLSVLHLTSEKTETIREDAKKQSKDAGEIQQNLKGKK